MAKDDFLSNLRAATWFFSPVDQANGIRLGPQHLSEVLKTSADWLTPTAVEDFDPADFPGLSEESKARLRDAVATFRDATGPSVDIDRALPAFMAILTELSPYLEGFSVYHALKRQTFPDIVRDFAVRVGGDWSGDPATWIWVIVADDAVGEGIRPKVREIRRLVDESLRRAKIRLHPYVMIRTESEQRELEMEDRVA